MSLPESIVILRRAPGMCLSSVTYDTIVSYLNGYNSAVNGGLLLGFREWLIVRIGDGNNLAWFALVLELKKLKEETAPVGVSEEKARINFVFDVLEKFLTQRSEWEGLRRIFFEYEQWLQSQDWYLPSDPQWLEPTKKKRARSKGEGRS